LIINHNNHIYSGQTYDFIMETITNAASTVTATVSNLIYGQPTKENETTTNETGGKEPISGEQGKGTISEPFDQGNSGRRIDACDTRACADYVVQRTP
jgi:hypothetical protein